ncbi:MAG: glycosyltransferase family 4 protein, partial [Alphaproteobacteria bacterium]|nr:glycosyltransferase family 4 protein [Alphaproteobacteria bacterium]
MRICHVIEAAGGGSGQVVLDLARAQRAEGQEVTVIYAPQRAEARFVKELSSLSGIKIVTSSMRRKVGLHDLADLSRLILRLRRHGPFDILHSHSSKAGALTRLANPFLPRAVHVYTPHAFMTLAPGASRLYGWIERVLSWL